MKHWKLAVALICFGTPVMANPYFRPLDLKSPLVNIGAAVDPVNVGNSQQSSVLCAISHSHNDGYLLIQGEDWCFLGVGYAASGTGASLILGPSFNMAPMTWKVLSVLAPEKYSQTIGSLGQGNFNLTFGPAFVYDPFYYSLDHKYGHGYFRFFSGAAWRF